MLDIESNLRLWLLVLSALARIRVACKPRRRATLERRLAVAMVAALSATAAARQALILMDLMDLL